MFNVDDVARDIENLDFKKFGVLSEDYYENFLKFIYNSYNHHSIIDINDNFQEKLKSFLLKFQNDFNFIYNNIIKNYNVYVIGQPMAKIFYFVDNNIKIKTTSVSEVKYSLIDLCDFIQSNPNDTFFLYAFISDGNINYYFRFIREQTNIDNLLIPKKRRLVRLRKLKLEQINEKAK